MNATRVVPVELTPEMDAVLRNEKCVYGSGQALYDDLLSAAPPAADAQVTQVNKSLRDDVEALERDLAKDSRFWSGELFDVAKRVRAILHRHDTTPRCMRPEGCVCGGDTEPVRMACSWMEKPKPQIRHPPADGVSVPRLLLRGLAQIADAHAVNVPSNLASRAHAADLKKQADAILAEGKA